jgi:uncharacterized protein (TIGR03435 family)
VHHSAESYPDDICLRERLQYDGTACFEQMAGPMLQGLLEERFKLKMNLETRELPVYALYVAKSGLKLKALKEGSFTVKPNLPPTSAPGQQPTDFCGSMTMKRNGPTMTIGAHGMTIADLSNGAAGKQT